MTRLSDASSRGKIRPRKFPNQVLDHVFSLLGLEGTDGVDQMPTRLEPRPPFAKDLGLRLAVLGKVGLAETPPDFGLAPEGSEPGARGIDQNPIEGQTGFRGRFGTKEGLGLRQV